MSINEPTRFEQRLMVSFSWLARPIIYRPFVERIGLKGDEKVLDFGAGWGDVTYCLVPKLMKGGSVTVMDPSSGWQETAKIHLRKYSGLTFVNSDILSAGFADASFDVVVVHFVLHHVPSETRESTVREIEKKLRPGGFVYISEPNSKKDGMPSEEIIELMTKSGLIADRARPSKRFFEGKFIKPAK